jgi:hypothetical protein
VAAGRPGRHDLARRYGEPVSSQWRVDGRGDTADSDRFRKGHDATAEFVFAALEADRPLLNDWRDTLVDIANEVDRLAVRGMHPDDRARARDIMHLLAGLWLDADENEALYLRAVGGIE